MGLSMELISQFMRDNVKYIVVYFIVNIFNIVVETVVFSVLVGKILTSFGKGDNRDCIYAMVAVFVISRLGIILRNLLNNTIIPKFYNFVRTEIYRRIINKYKTDYKELNIGYVLYNFDHIPTSFRLMVIDILKEYVPNIISLAICIIFFFFKNKYIGAMTLFGLLIIITIILCTSGKNTDLSYDSHRKSQIGNEHIQDRISNLFDIYTSGTEEDEIKEFVEMDIGIKESSQNYYTGIISFTSISDIIIIVILTISMYILYVEFGKGKIKQDEAVTIVLVLTHLIRYYINLINHYIEAGELIGFSRVSDTFLVEINPEEIPDIPHEMYENTNYRGAIELKGVKFEYPETGKTTLDDVNLTIEPGTRVAIFGKSGSGKSTIIKLILGFNRPNEGGIFIGGVNINNIPVHVLRSNIAVVNQNIRLFDRSIFDNMIYGAPGEVTKEMIYEIIGEQNIFSEIDGGLDANVGVSGSNLSGGQKQIINVVRAILKNTPIIILDEPTSALDLNTKEMIMSVLDRLNDKTILIITHDNSLLNYVDAAFRLKDGVLESI